jgi:hypothetical protein
LWERIEVEIVLNLEIKYCIATIYSKLRQSKKIMHKYQAINGVLFPNCCNFATLFHFTYLQFRITNMGYIRKRFIPQIHLKINS